jgi:hypothetical protein
MRTFGAFTVPGATAAGTTAGECSPAVTMKDFEDTHCDKSKSPGTYGEVLYPVNTPVAVEAANDLTSVTAPFTLAGKLSGIVSYPVRRGLWIGLRHEPAV